MDNIGFHESEVVNCCLMKGVFYLNLSDVTCNDQKVSVAFEVSGNVSVLVDKEPSVNVQQCADDGEILTLDVLPGGLYCLIEWHDYSCRKNTTKSYRVEGDVVTIKVDRGKA